MVQDVPREPDKDSEDRQNSSSCATGFSWCVGTLDSYGNLPTIHTIHPVMEEHRPGVAQTCSVES